MMQAIANRGESLRSVTALLKTVIIADRIYIVKSEKNTIKSTQQFSLQSDLDYFICTMQLAETIHLAYDMGICKFSESLSFS